MSNYKISLETYRIAKELGIKISVSTNQDKKIDIVDKNGNKFSIGDSGYSDYHVYKKTHGIKYANERRRLYIL